MKSSVALLVVVLVLSLAAPAAAGWHTHWVSETYSVTVHPNPVWTCNGWRVPSPYSERRTRWAQQLVWVNDPVYCTPIYISPPIYCTPIYSTPCPTHVVYPGVVR